MCWGLMSCGRVWMAHRQHVTVCCYRDCLHMLLCLQCCTAPAYFTLSCLLPCLSPAASCASPRCCHLQQQLPADKASKEQWWYPFAKIGCGAAAGIAAQTASYPLDTLRRRLQVNGAPGTSLQYKGYLHCLRHMAQHKEGLLRQLFRGWGINCLKTAPGAAVQFVAYDLLRLAVTSIDPAGAVSPL